MNTKNKFFADFFINELDNLSRKIKEFGEGDESLFGQETDDDIILSSIQYIEEQWENCVNRKAEEGYPVCFNPK
ncbi:hypothetical protein [Perlabentimonas gracilis]|uniref:hypothetical protein n=1 Tax=Perlabentimonas gracilis TaxID=2715279 RepID=UPI00140B72C5|nr:hypothetical protein [Perlabentimonas gracilis]NHB70307.1 hypothetical protein [Perlabentimonas gracilis]